MSVQRFSYEIALLFTKYARYWANLFNKKLNCFEKHSLGKDTLFATICVPPTPNLQFLVQSSVIALSSILPAAVALEIVLP